MIDMKTQLLLNEEAVGFIFFIFEKGLRYKLTLQKRGDVDADLLREGTVDS